MPKNEKQRMQFSLAISADEYLAYYKQQVTQVVVRTDDDQRLRFPASAIQQHLTHEGIYGRFEIEFDAAHKLVGVTKI